MKINEILLEAVLFEARGLYARKPGEIFKGTDGDNYELISITSYPKIGSYESSDNMIKQLQRISRGSEPIVVNKFNPNVHKAFGLAIFLNTNTKKKVDYIKYFDKISPNMMGKWANNELPNLSYQSGASIKSKSNFKPQNLFGGKNTFKSGMELYHYLMSSSDIGDDIKAGIEMLVDGKMPVFAGNKDNLGEIRDYLSETLDPLVVTLAPNLLTGAFDKAHEEILDNIPLTQLGVEFPMSQTSGFADCYLTTKTGERLGISSKGGKGANASAKNIWDVLKTSEKKNKALHKKYSEAVKIIETIANTSSLDGPIILGKDLGLINEAQAKEIKTHINNSERKFQNLSKWAQKYIESYDTTKPEGWNYGYWLLAALAKKVGEKINGNANFGKAFVAFLNNSNIIQIYAKATTKGNDVVFTGFDAIYPAKFDGRVKIESGKTYSASGIKGRYTFSFNKSEAADVADIEPRSSFATGKTRTMLSKPEPKPVKPRAKRV